MEAARWYKVISDKNDGVMNYKVKVKVKFILDEAKKAQRGSIGIALLII